MTEFRPSRFEILPIIVKNLLIINGLFYLAQVTFSKGAVPVFSFEDTLALHAWQSDLFKPWQLITHMFLHGDFYHILGNMFALWMFGSILENVWGAKRFLTFYLICGLGAALIHLLFLSYELTPIMKDYALVLQQQNDPMAFVDAMASFGRKYNMGFNEEALVFLKADPSNTLMTNKVLEAVTTYYNNRINTATLGASGAVFGILAAFVYLFPNTYIYLYFLVPVKAKWLGLIYFSYELFFALQNSAGDNVARWAHIGGAIVGLLIVITWNKTNKKTLY
ncbi:MAG: rhomboid family intramembrane serine protease [Sediminibacterium sp. Gen4]|jgi:membrane associated rhomboid family serine protease|uniref:rhomboid family intramembrane serine protease n=1 Tax=unclassified Sediminibacterium TaxID=2635961 RepID=UPI0015BAB317|nr:MULTISPECIES: rhomboid family intramembrane serine protease [unclassified Sediminibacterium]MBW0160240.1 rhomboid family intramembrane serine protease [Sediminibacterium sp.]MBW0162779.1 rhomboid family intramembrane serine protease [Sediminibacterium sp.]NWK66281.1 rhomboid family intramembrane serine protease [Sediminibacterium sp. Gen4]